ncbi:CDP-glycerol glycerophosphotransferase family protein [candidate division KSB1 bacterium]|nr:CDP-glycerol glycerophosphotransferase family protein [candidate division KSB1 bacterium]
MEKEYWEAQYSYGDVGDSVNFVVNGTPNDLSFDPAISKTEALRSLDLKDEQFTVTVASTWIEAHRPSNIIAGQVDHAEFFKTTLRALAELRKSNEKIQVIIKLHPAFARNPVWSDTVSYLERFAESIGLRIDLIAYAKLSEVIAASDLMICPHTSSLLWEFFLGDKPGIVLPLSSCYKDKYDIGKLNDSNILFREKCMKYVFDQDELVAAIHYYMNGKNHSQYIEAAHAIRKENDIQLLTVDEKCQNICRWIEEFLSDNEQPKSSDIAVADAGPGSGRADWLFQTARQLIDAGKTREGLSLLNQVLRFDSAHAATLNLMGDIYHQHGQEGRAREM